MIEKTQEVLELRRLDPDSGQIKHRATVDDLCPREHRFRVEQVAQRGALDDMVYVRPLFSSVKAFIKSTC